jgi:nifR3 family TIM-barrel protein
MEKLYRPLSLGKEILPGNIFLAPLAGFTDAAFRGVAVKLGADLSYSEMLSAEGFVRNNKKTIDLLQRAEEEEFFGVQIFTDSPYSAAKAVGEIGLTRPTLIDLNCGCPVPKVVKTGAGSGLLKNPRLVFDLVKAMTENTDIPITVKIRSGWDSSAINYLETADAAVQGGARLICLHARTRAQGYSGKANWDHIKELKEKSSVPVFGSGDLFTPEDVRAMLSETNCDGVMIARGAIGNPFIFREIRDFLSTGGYEPITQEERLATALEHLDRCAALKGESLACKEMRKHFCSYVKGIPGSARFRNLIVHADTREDYVKLSSDFLNNFS